MDRKPSPGPQAWPFLSAGLCLLPDSVILSLKLSLSVSAEIPRRYAWLRQCFHPYHQRYYHQPGSPVDGTAHSDHLHVQPVPSLAPLQSPARPGLCAWAHGPPETRRDQDHWHHCGPSAARRAGTAWGQSRRGIMGNFWGDPAGVEWAMSPEHWREERAGSRDMDLSLEIEPETRGSALALSSCPCSTVCFFSCKWSSGCHEASVEEAWSAASQW